MQGFINSIKELLEVIERMAGGKKRATIAFWLVFILAVCLSAKFAWDSVAYVVSKFSFASPIVAALASIIFLIVGFGAMFAVVTLIAAIPAQFMRTLFDSNFRIRINDTLIGLMDILRKANQDVIDKEMAKQLLDDTEYMYAKWQRTKTNRVMHWILPDYFKKGSEKWTIISKTELDKYKSNKKRQEGRTSK